MVRSSTHFLGACSKPYPGITDPLVADGIIFAKLRGFSHVVLEANCLEVVDLWISRHGSHLVATPLRVKVGELAVSFQSFDI